MKNQRIHTVIGLVFSAMIGVGVVSVGLSLWTNSSQAHDALLMNLAGRQRMLSQRVARAACSARQAGHENDRTAVRTAVQQFKEGLNVLLEGGELHYAGRTVIVAPTTEPSFQEALEKVAREGEGLERATRSLIEGEPGGPAFLRAARDLELSSDRVLEAMDEAVRIYQQHAESKVARMRWIQLLLLSMGAAIVATGFRVVQNQVVKPVDELEKAVLRMERGDLDHPVTVRVDNELGRLARTFEGMRAAVRDRMKEQEEMSRFSRALLEEREEQRVMDRAVETAAGMLRADCAALSLVEEDGRTYSCRATYGWPEHACGHGGPWPLGADTGVAYAIRSGEPVVVTDQRNEHRFETPPFVLEQGITSSLFLPVLVGDRPVGAMVVNCRERRDFSREDVRLLSLVAHQAMIALERLSEHRRVKEAEERYRDLFESSSDMIQSVAPDGRFIYANPAWRRALGFTEDELSALSMFDDVLHPSSRVRYREACRHIMETGKDGLVEVELLTRDGRTIWVEGNISCRYENGRPVANRGIFRDVTERRRVERMKDEFISTVSHEMRTPLTSIHGALAIMSSGQAGEMPPGAGKLLEIASRNSTRLKNLIEDLLDMQKMQEGNMEFHMESLELGPLVDEAIEENGEFGRQLRVEFVRKDDLSSVRVRADGARLKQVLTNLLSNAAKFSDPGGTVEVSLSRRDGMVRVAVKDHGPGIPETFRDHVFEKFTQADSSNTRQTGGTGLGLHICKLIIDRHEGCIDFESETGAGTTFYFELPELRGQA
jgi:PAS domain S-box-containing protein